MVNRLNKWKITNVVVAAQLNINVDLYDLCSKVGSVEKSNVMPCLVWRHKNIIGTALLFSSGYISVHGNMNVCNAKRAMRQFARLLQRKGYSPKLGVIRVLTISGSCKVTKKHIDLYRLATRLHSLYEPELFPALIYSRNKLKMLVYSSGSVVITGIKNSTMSYRLVNDMLGSIRAAAAVSL